MRALLALISWPLLSACSSASATDSSGSSAPATTSLSTAAAPSTHAAALTATASASSPTILAPPGEPEPAPTVDPLIGTGRADVDEVIPGVSIGPVKLGMTREELKGIHLWVRPFTRGKEDDHVLLVGPYYVVLRDGRVDSIESTINQMPKGLRIRGQVLPWRSKFETIAAAFSDCEPLRRGLCGNSFRCEGKRLLVKSACGAGMIHVQIFAKPALDPGEEGYQ